MLAPCTKRRLSTSYQQGSELCNVAKTSWQESQGLLKLLKFQLAGPVLERSARMLDPYGGCLSSS